MRFDLDADVVILSGPNGSGKTSVFDAFLWGLTGDVARFPSGDVVSHFATSGEAFVSLTLSDGRSSDLHVTRTLSRDAEHDRLLVESDGVRAEGASNLILQRLWPAALSSEEPGRAFAMALTRSVYLQQDLVRQFLTDDSAEARFTVLSELVGIGRLTELIRELESARNRWHRAGTRENEALQAIEARLLALRQRISRLSPASEEQARLDVAWRSWWMRAAQEHVARDAEDALRAAPSAPESPLALDRAISAVEAARRLNERRAAAARSLADELARAPSFTGQDDVRARTLAAEVGVGAARLADLRKQLAGADAAAAAERRQRTATRTARAEIEALAELALRHLSERCPVCDQSYDKDATEARLRSFLVQTPEPSTNEVLDRPTALAAQIEKAERELSERRAASAAIEERRSLATQWASVLATRLAELGLAPSTDNMAGEVAAEVARLEADLGRLATLQKDGESLSLLVTSATESAQRQQIERDALALEAEATAKRAELQRHDLTYDTASAIIQGARKVAWDAVGAQIRAIGPVSERIYARIDPHPVLTDIVLETDTTGQRGKVSIRVADRIGAGLSLDPATVLSSSQLNGLAVSLFLAFSLSVRESPLACVLLDDPLQSLDDVNLLGVVDVCRRVKERRQMIISTHNERFAALLRRKLRPVNEQQRTLSYSFDEWTRDGPLPVRTEVQASSSDILVAA